MFVGMRTSVMKLNVVDLAIAIKVDGLNSKDCQHLANIYNSDVKVLINSEALIGDDCVSLIELLKETIIESTSLFLQVSLDDSSDAYRKDEIFVAAIKQIVAYCLVAIVNEDNCEIVIQAINILLHVYSKSGLQKHAIVTMNVLTVISNLIHKIILNASSGKPMTAKCVRGHSRNKQPALDVSDDEEDGECDGDAVEADEDQPRRSQRQPKPVIVESKPSKKMCKNVAFEQNGRLVQLLRYFLLPDQTIMNLYGRHTTSSIDVLIDVFVLLATHCNGVFSKDVIQISRDVLHLLAGYSNSLLVGILRSSTPILTYGYSDHRLVHLNKSSKTEFNNISKECVCLLSSIVDSYNQSFEYKFAEYDADYDAGEGSAERPLSLCMQSWIGFLQRCTLRYANDTHKLAYSRESVCSYLVDLFGSLVKLVYRLNLDLKYADNLLSLLSFWIKCSKAENLQVRLTSIEVLVGLTGKKSVIWTLMKDPTKSALNTKFNWKSIFVDVLNSLASRVNDISNVVSQKAIQLIHDFVSSYNTGGQSEEFDIEAHHHD